MKDYYEANKEKKQEYQKIYNEANKAKNNSKVKCECGCIVMKRFLKRHQTSNKYLDKMKNINNPSI